MRSYLFVIFSVSSLFLSFSFFFLIYFPTPNPQTLFLLFLLLNLYSPSSCLFPFLQCLFFKSPVLNPLNFRRLASSSLCFVFSLFFFFFQMKGTSIAGFVLILFCFCFLFFVFCFDLSRPCTSIYELIKKKHLHLKLPYKF